MSGTGRDLHIDAPLSNMVIGFEPEGLIVQDIFPVVPVDKQSDNYFVWTKADFFRVPDTRRAPMTEARKTHFSVSSDTYFAHNYALSNPYSWEDMKNADNVIAGYGKRANGIKNLLMLDWERRVANKVTSGTNLGSYTTLAGINQWNDKTNSYPFDDIEAGKSAIRSTTGKLPNTLILGYEVFRYLKLHPHVLDRLKYTGRDSATPEMLARLFELDRVLVGKSILNSAAEGLSASFGDVWGKNAILMHTTTGPDATGTAPSLGYTFRWNSDIYGGLEMAAMVRSDEEIKADMVEVGMYQDEKLTTPELGYGIMNAVA